MTRLPAWSDVAIALALLGSSLAIVATALYRLPPDLNAPLGLWPRGVLPFAQALGVQSAPLPASSARGALAGGFVAAWLAYAALLLALRRHRSGLGRVMVGAAIAFAGVMALAFPPALSSDLYIYVAYARLPVVHGLDPYVHAPTRLAALGDPVAPYLAWDAVSMYGSLWTLLSMAVIAPLKAASLFVQAAALKLTAAAALVATAFAARGAADRLEPGRGALAFMAVAANPLLLIEGPGTGHNDAVLAAFLMAAIYVWLRGGARVGALLLGAAAAIKPITFPLLIWWALLRARTSLRRALEILVAGCLPLVLSGLAFQRAAGFLQGLERQASVRVGGAPTLLLVLGANSAIFAGTTIWIWRSPPEREVWQRAWVVLAGALVLLWGGSWFPWYLAWSIPVALVRWDRQGVAATLVLSALAVALLLVGYALG